ncbi:hypothetical protein M422DRAFT_248800 [Sphaerobolus stellatus SS14]|nr:hypothetical protein M422DRAFT_248800 [Sphaerobolus stellatus SS14]
MAMRPPACLHFRALPHQLHSAIHLYVTRIRRPPNHAPLSPSHQGHPSTSRHLCARSSVDLHTFCHLQASPSTSTPYTRTHPLATQPAHQPAHHALPISPHFKHAPASTSCACTHPFTSCPCLHAMHKGTTAPPPRCHVSARRPSALAPCTRWFFDLHGMR